MRSRSSSRLAQHRVNPPPLIILGIQPEVVTKEVDIWIDICDKIFKGVINRRPSALVYEACSQIQRVCEVKNQRKMRTHVISFRHV